MPVQKTLIHLTSGNNGHNKLTRKKKNFIRAFVCNVSMAEMSVFSVNDTKTQDFF